MRRYAELDLLRTLAIILMIVYHLCYDLETFYGWELGMFEYPSWMIFQKSIAALFLLLVGISFAISWDRHQRKYDGWPFRFLWIKYWLRGLGLIICGLLVSVVTYLWDPASYVRFGILHLIGMSILALPFFARLREWNAAIGIAIIALGMNMPPAYETELLLPLGMMPPNFFSVDYFPLIPWFGVVLIGIAIGHIVYVQHRRPTAWDDLPAPQWMVWPGRHALPVYLVHQPILLRILGILL